MDKIILSTKDVQALIKWRDEHNDLVRKMPMPFKAIEMQFPQTKVIIKGFRDGDNLRLQVSKRGLPMGYVDYIVLPSGLCIGKEKKSKLRTDEAQDCLTVYCSLMALITYANKRPDVETPVNYMEASGKKKRSVSKRNGLSVTYLLSAASGVDHTVEQARERKKPNHAFSVRGHFRHYKSGKVVWIEQHVRCDGKKKSKNYKLGGGMDAKSEIYEQNREVDL